MAARIVVYRLDANSRTGALVGYGSLVAPALVLLHPPANRRALVDEDLRRVRCQIIGDDKLAQAIDGDLLRPDVTLPGPPTAVDLDWIPDATSTPVPGVEDPGLSAADVAAAAARFTTAQAEDDPATPPLPPPDHAGTGSPVTGEPGRRPWYCVITPGARACHS